VDEDRGGDWVEYGFPTTLDPERFRHLIEHVRDAVVEFELVDDEPIVRGVNPAFVDVFGYDAGAVVGSSLNEHIVPTWLEDEAATLDERTRAGKVNYRRVRRDTARGLREFLYRGVPYGADRGFAVYTDLTADRRNRSRGDVFNRVLRHNLRNAVTLVAGSVERLVAELEDDDLGPEARRARENLRAGVEDLRTLSREATELYRIVNASAPDDARVDCASLTRSIADRFDREYADASIDLELPEALPVAATDELAVAIASLVENAIEHNPADEPRVRIEGGTEADQWCSLAVCDDGPGIPPVEREVITGAVEIGELRHGSGLGLWLVKWTVETFGGTVSFGRSRDGGSRVRLRLPRWDDDG
jgi:PAS domain S-box-containing protein